MAQGDRIEIDYDYCYQSGECVLFVPEVYRFGEEGYPELVEGGVEKTPTSALAGTVDDCPSGAITLIRGKGG
ncbi:MAG: (4Fe-4S)-binding protein [Actinomycetia bacterium]|nr:(4Fe-4S)-binding protein [Actinomycetes bacterium]